MKYFSTNNPKHLVSAQEAVIGGLAPDGGLYMPQDIPKLPTSFFLNLDKQSLQDIGKTVSAAFIGGEVSEADISTIIEETLNFEIPLVPLTENIFSLELFHGPTLAFKDVGARFMARLMKHFRRNSNKKLSILVATSGDTGSAVANGFYDVEGIEVFILYPSGKVSPLQEKQLTTLGKNITALEIDGSFDDCQSLVKAAFVDKQIQSAYELSSANSINIARLIPQSFYYFHGVAELQRQGVADNTPILASIPSGNFGNLTAGLFAKRMGLGIDRFIASTNANDVFVKYLQSGDFSPHPSIPTISNAMDVGNPSNFARMLSLYDGSLQQMQQDISAYRYSDEQTKTRMLEVFSQFNYVLDPHGAIGLMGLEQALAASQGAAGFFIETAHPSKFVEVVSEVLNSEIDIPKRLSELQDKEKNAITLSSEFSELKNYLLGK